MYQAPAVSARRYFLDGLAQGELRYQFDPVSGKAVFFPREVAPSGRLGGLEWRVSKGRGVIYSFTEVFRRDEMYNVVLVDLDEGFRVMSTIPGAQPRSLRIGQAVQAGFDVCAGEQRLVFEVLS
ncbi:MAG: OB-fold domain-containing protein [Candidimonas sp.]